ncbi:MAG: tryptophan synthase subunit alpha [Deltaproteobacteria bacterium]|jgi:tryptophan synthase alpha chain|nr:tryptophan synthase subunit alpha [Deltaproteobacteria bacterium]
MKAPDLRQRIEKANAEGRMARIPFLTAGFPDKERFFSALRELDGNGADIIEIGVPFSDPVADGPVVEEASRRALENGVNLPWLLESLASLSPPLKAGLVLMGYYNPFLQYGLGRLAREAARAGAQGVIVPDLPLDEDSPLRDVLRPAGLNLIPLVGPNTGEKRMAAYAEKGEGYVYVVSVMGTTGARDLLPPEAESAVARARRIFPLPVALGFGLQNPAQVAGMKEKPQAVVFGSALLRCLEQGGSVKDFMAPWLKG